MLAGSKGVYGIFLTCGIVLALAPMSFGQRLSTAVVGPPGSSEVTSEPSHAKVGAELDVLRRRIEQLEDQNRSLHLQNREVMQLLAELKARLDLSTASGSERVNLSTASGSERVNRVKEELPVELKAKSDGPSGLAAEKSRDAGAATTEKAEPAQGSGEAARWSDLISDGNRFKLYGSVRLDLIYDSRAPNNPQSPLFIPSPQTSGFFSPRDSGNFTMHPRLTTFGIDYFGPQVSTLADGRLSGKLEVDFQNGGPEFAAALRILQAYLKMDWGDVFILGGQKWDTVSPLRPTVNDDSVMFTAGNVGLRRAQLLAGYESTADTGGLSLVGGIGLTGAVDGADRDFDGLRDGEESERPHLQGRIGYSHPLLAQRLAIGLSGAYGFSKVNLFRAGRRDIRTRLANVDFTLPLAEFISLRGEGWWGRNISDFGGGAGQIGLIFSAVPGLPGEDEICAILPDVNCLPVRGRGGWSELGIKVSRYWSIHPGFTTDDPRDEDVFDRGITRNRAIYVGNRLSAGDNLVIGIDYLRWKTNFKGLARGLDNRVNIFFKYSF